MSKHDIRFSDPCEVAKTIVATIAKVHYATDNFILEVDGVPVGGVYEGGREWSQE